MIRFTMILGLLVGVVATFSSPSNAQVKKETMDQKIRRQIVHGDIDVKIQEQTRDPCDRGDLVTITSTTDGDVVLRPGEEKYFKIDKDKDKYTGSGGWYFKCGSTPEKARIKGASIIRATRKENGVIDWYWVLIEPK